MKILFYDTKKYDKESFDKVLPKYEDIEIEYVDSDISVRNAVYAKGFEAVCGFVSSDFSGKVIDVLADNGVKIILLRCAGFNNVDISRAKERGVLVFRVPGYSPEAVAEHAMALALASNRHIHKGYIKVRENNFSLVGLTGLNFFKKTAGIIGTGKIGAAMCRICKGFGMRIIAYDIYQNPDLDFVEYVDLDTLLAESDLISLHCPLTEQTHHLINRESIAKMKDGVILVNTSRGGLVNTEELIEGIRKGKFFAVGLDVYEEENDKVYEDLSGTILQSSTMARLLSFPNVMVTSHQGFFTREALEAISRITLENAAAFEKGETLENEVTK